MMRINLKIALIFVCTAVFFVTLSLWTRCGSIRTTPTKIIEEANQISPLPDTQDPHEIECLINGEDRINCLKEGDEVYIPFRFIHRYFEVYGKLARYDDYERFEWSHSYSKVYHPKGKYDPRGIFMFFENYNVEVRDRVKCVSGSEGVPVSTQWESQGYYYPTQIAQFALSHYSKNLTEPEPRRKIIEDGDHKMGKWVVPFGAMVNRSLDVRFTKYLQFATNEALSGAVSLKLDHVLDFVLSMDVNLQANGSVRVILQNREKKEVFNLHYIISDVMISIQVSLSIVSWVFSKFQSSMVLSLDKVENFPGL